MAHQMLKPYSFLLYLLAIIAFFFVGVTYAGIVEAGKGQMLAGGAIVFGYGVIGSFLGFIMALIVAIKANRKPIIRLNIVLAISIIAFFGYYRIKYQKKQQDKLEQSPPKNKLPKTEQQKKQTTPVAEPVIEAGNETAMLTLKTTNAIVQKGDKNSGLGMFIPHFSEQSVLYFYGNPHLEKSLRNLTPIDSITFKKSEYGGYDIATAPPWLVPDHLKLDYDLLYFNVQSVTQEFVEVTVNTTNQQTAYVSRYAGKMNYWPDFLLNVHSVEFPDPDKKNIYEKPLMYAGKISTPYSFMKPLRITNEWMYVELLDNSYQPLGNGWIKWTKEGKLLVRYSLLS